MVKRIIEFVAQATQDYNIIITIDAEEILGIEQNEKFSGTLMLSNGNKYKVIGKHRNLVNRWIYCLQKNSKADIYYDKIIRPSVSFYNNNIYEIETDPMFIDSEQLKAFISVIDPILLEKPLIIEKLIY